MELEIPPWRVVPLPLPLGEVSQCAHWGGEGVVRNFEYCKIRTTPPLRLAKCRLRRLLACIAPAGVSVSPFGLPAFNCGMIATGNHNFEKFAALCNTLSGEQRRLRRSGRQVGDPYKLKSFWLAVTNGIPTYSPFTLTYYLRPHKWALPGGLGHQRIRTPPCVNRVGGAN